MQVGVSILTSDVFGSLPDAANIVYFAMCAESGKNREFRFSRGIERKYGFKDERRYYRGVEALIAAGFIERIEEPGAAQYAPTKFRFSFVWKGIKPK